MKRQLYTILLLCSLAANAALVYTFILSGSTTEVTDQRTAILLNEGERELVLGEMRMFLSSTQQIVAGIDAGDLSQVAKAARAVGKRAAQGVPGSLMGKLPMEFKQLGMATHAAFDQLAMDAEQIEDPEHAMAQLGTLLKNCVVCHAAFQIRPPALPK